MLDVVINFSSNEASFFQVCIEEILHFSRNIVVPVCDHFFDGTLENDDLLNQIYRSYPELHFIQYPFSRENFYGRHPAPFWHNISRLVGVHFLPSSAKYILFLDIDEIVEGKRFAQWVEDFPIEDYAAIRFACYWYFREPKYCALDVEEGPLLLQKDQWNYDLAMHPGERGGIFSLVRGKKMGLMEKEKPLFHHYSWVRSKEGLLRKVRSWGHRGEKDWEAQIDEEYSRPFSGRDFVHGYRFREVKPKWKFAWKERGKKNFSKNVTFLTTHDLHKIDLQLRCLS